MTNKTFILVLVTIIFLGTITAGSILYVKEHSQIEHISNTNQIKELEAKETWQNVGKALYFDTKSVKVSDSYVEGTFKQYNLNNDVISGKIYAYKTIWIGAYCNVFLEGGLKKLEYPIYKYYDIKGDLLAEENIHKTWAENYPDGHLGITYAEDIENGKIYFKTLCKYFNR